MVLKSPSYIREEIEKTDALLRELGEPGSIILFHDGGRDKPGTLQAVDLVIGKLRAQGYRFVTVSELLALGRG